MLRCAQPSTHAARPRGEQGGTAATSRVKSADAPRPRHREARQEGQEEGVRQSAWRGARAPAFAFECACTDTGRAVMASGAALQNHNNELVKCIEDLREKREELARALVRDEEEKAKIQQDLAVLTKRLTQLNDNLARKVASRNEYDKTIAETEAAYMKILESSQTLLTVLKRESVHIAKKSARNG